MSIQYSKSSFFKLRFIFHFDCELFTFMIDHALIFFTVFTFLLLFISNLFTNLLFKCTQSLLKNLHVFNSIHFFAFLTWMTMYWRLILHASLFAYNWMDLTKLYRTCHYLRAYKGIHCLCCYLYIEGIGQWQADWQWSELLFLSITGPSTDCLSGHLLTVCQTIYWLSVRSFCTGSDHDGKSIS